MMIDSSKRLNVTFKGLFSLIYTDEPVINLIKLRVYLMIWLMNDSVKINRVREVPLKLDYNFFIKRWVVSSVI
jgi:hypothetical protein